MKINKIYIFAFLALIFSQFLSSHGFAQNTLIVLSDESAKLPIQNISQNFFLGQKTVVATYKEKSKKWKSKHVQAVAFCDSCVFLQLNFINRKKVVDTIKCSPLQLFYRLNDQKWIPAAELCTGDTLLCKDNATVRLQSNVYVEKPIKLFIIEVKKHHTFAVGSAKILTHNMFIPLAATMGMAVPFDVVCTAGSLGCMFGPVTFCCSVAVAGIAAAVAYQCSKSKHIDFALTSKKPGCFEMQPIKDNLFLHSNVITNPSDHVKNTTNPVGCFTLQPVQDSLFLYHDNECKKSVKIIEDILKGLPKGEKTKGRADQYIKKGDYDDAVKDFYSLNPSNVRKLPGKEGFYGILADGRTINVRLESTLTLEGSTKTAPTIEIQKAKGVTSRDIKIRYEN